jgi:Ca2+/Na+ antiporter
MIPNLFGYVFLYFKADYPLQKLRYFTMPGLCAVWQSVVIRVLRTWNSVCFLSFYMWYLCWQMRSPKEVSKEEYNTFCKSTFKEFIDPQAYTHFTTEVRT